MYIAIRISFVDSRETVQKVYALFQGRWSPVVVDYGSREGNSGGERGGGVG